jgi:hypothetical protein
MKRRFASIVVIGNGKKPDMGVGTVMATAGVMEAMAARSQVNLGIVQKVFNL